MKKVFNGVCKFFVANAAVVITIILLPVFLVTDDVSLFDQIMDYLFNDES
ncbi:hypothetical protein F3157_13915 [Virgibacillus dakarensis]|uniref:Uncharacterized protein n=1 Tax=Lentibacillus populi TaxID=1827502 RepID=A0A9W5TWW4_9BACI|nr:MULTISPECIES: hypothetical protein [Bacillaceae]MBT2217317.1 hypothetical protein [Virgibacillus dakarensis]MTW86749.1 hypothetical protein [Virgibacillus dakarensis]GGB38086.1 hypothetical protein GCM10011409_14430 [Lentibacillus populi]